MPSHSTDFNITDQIFGYDVSFYAFKLEFITEINNILIPIIVGFCGGQYHFYLMLFRYRKPYFLMSPSLPRQERRQEQNNNPLWPVLRWPGRARVPLAAARAVCSVWAEAAAAVSIKTPSPAWSVSLAISSACWAYCFPDDRPALFPQTIHSAVHLQTGVVYGAGFTDNVALWVYRILIVLSIAAAVMFVIGLNKRSLKKKRSWCQ